jgi:hypothetical protein
VTGSVNQAIALGGRAPTGQQVFWTKISGPGEAVFGHEMFNASFEDGTIHEWDGDGGGEQTPGTNAYVSTDEAHSGTHSWAAYNDPAIADPVLRFSAKLLRWRFDRAEGYYSAWYYWPSAYVVNTADNYVNIFQFKEDGAPFDPNWIVIGKAYGGVDQLAIHTYAGANIFQTGVAIPKDQWFNITAYMKTGTSTGRFIVWLTTTSGTQRLFDQSNLNTLGAGVSTLMWGVGNYGKPGIGAGKFFYVDDTEVADATVDSRSTTATFSRPGTYVLRLTAYDGTRTLSDDVQVTVN